MIAALLMIGAIMPHRLLRGKRRRFPASGMSLCVQRLVTTRWWIERISSSAITLNAGPRDTRCIGPQCCALVCCVTINLLTEAIAIPLRRGRADR
jgi:hypothetical protein